MVSQKDRLEFLRLVVDAAEAIVLHPHVQQRLPEAGERLAYLMQQGVLFVPTGCTEDGKGELEEVACLSKSPPEFGAELKLIPFHPADRFLGRFYAYAVESVVLTAYGCKNHCILINLDAGETIRFVGGSLLHEIGHAICATRDGRAYTDGDRPRTARLEEELHVWQFDHDLNLAVCGPVYKQRLYDLVERYIQPKRAEENFGIRIRGDGTILDYFYGEALSPRARDKRARMVAVYAFFLEVELSVRSGAKEKKLRAMETLLDSSYAQEEALIRQYRRREL